MGGEEKSLKGRQQVCIVSVGQISYSTSICVALLGVGIVFALFHYGAFDICKHKFSWPQSQSDREEGGGQVGECIYNNAYYYFTVFHESPTAASYSYIYGWMDGIIGHWQQCENIDTRRASLSWLVRLKFILGQQEAGWWCYRDPPETTSPKMESTIYNIIWRKL